MPGRVHGCWMGSTTTGELGAQGHPHPEQGIGAHTWAGVAGGADTVLSSFLWPLNISLEVNLLSWRKKIVVLTFQEIPKGKILKIKWVGLRPSHLLRGDK